MELGTVGAVGLAGSARTIAIRPVRTSSVIPNGRIRSMKAQSWSHGRRFRSSLIFAHVDDATAKDVDQLPHLTALAARRRFDLSNIRSRSTWSWELTSSTRTT